MFLMKCQEHVSHHLINRMRKELSMIKVFNKLFEHLTRGEYKEFFKLILVLFPFIAFFGIIIVLAINFASKHIQVIDEVNFTGATWLIVMTICDNDYAIVLENRAQTNEMISSNKDDFTFYNDRDF
jgi:hypothetical protein